MLKDDVNTSSVFADTQKLGRRRDCYESEREVVIRVTCRTRSKETVCLPSSVWLFRNQTSDKHIKAAPSDIHR